MKTVNLIDGMYIYDYDISLTKYETRGIVIAMFP